MKLLDGQRALITGAGSGIGQVMAQHFEKAGARIWICDADTNNLEQSLKENPDWNGTPCDVSDENQVDQLFKEMSDSFGGLEILVNNAGIAGPTAPVEEIDPGEWRRSVGVNLNGAFYCTRLATPLLKNSPKASIINISSVAGRLGFARRLPYASTKWAMIGFTESLAKELGPSGIRVNALLPGIVEGPRIEGVFQARAESEGVPYEEVRDRVLNNVSMKRMVSAGDVAEMAVFLCSEAGKNISGQSISVCGNVENL
ncbi:MAG: SDR family oxidoreductase [Deltaproteobacteria bacterium]|jgi:NAD(P)-dependent dehydrogenase (short-subunit alcohol dehydrogenase family)